MLNDWIAKRGFDQATAAKALGISQPRVSELARGKIQLFSLDKLVTMMENTDIKIQNIEIA